MAGVVDVADPGDGALGDRPLGFSTEGNVDPPASPGGTNGSDYGSNAPSPIMVDIGPSADDHGMTEDGVGGATVSPVTNTTPPRQSARLYPSSMVGTWGRVGMRRLGGGGQLNG